MMLFRLCSTYLGPSCLKQFHLIIESEICEAGDLLGPADGGHQLPVVEVGQERHGLEGRRQETRARGVQAGQQPRRLTAGQGHQHLVILQRHTGPPPPLLTRPRGATSRGLHRIPGNQYSAFNYWLKTEQRSSCYQIST